MLKLPAQFAKFGLVGLVNTLVHAMVLSACVEILGWHPVAGNCLAFGTANVASFIMNSYWTFKASPNLRRYVKFLTSSLLALSLTLGIAWVFEAMELHYGLGFIGIMVLVPPLNYWMLKRWAFTGH